MSPIRRSRRYYVPTRETNDLGTKPKRLTELELGAHALRVSLLGSSETRNQLELNADGVRLAATHLHTRDLGTLGEKPVPPPTSMPGGQFLRPLQREPVWRFAEGPPGVLEFEGKPVNKDIVVLRNGFPVNFNGDYETGSHEDIQYTRASMMLAAAQALRATVPQLQPLELGPQQKLALACGLKWPP
jgi:hypothetical protein